MSGIFVFDLDGKFIRKAEVPIQLVDFYTPFPPDINNGKFYQLLENAGNEEMERHITPIK